MNPQWHTPGEIREALEPLLDRWAELLLLAPFRRAVDLVVDGVAPEDAAFHRLAQSAITDGEESAVEDAARAIIRARAA